MANRFRQPRTTANVNRTALGHQRESVDQTAFSGPAKGRFVMPELVP
jgi:hypothetical protein